MLAALPRGEEPADEPPPPPIVPEELLLIMVFKWPWLPSGWFSSLWALNSRFWGREKI
jgi:hypothetical protein